MALFPATETLAGIIRILHIASAIALAGGGFLWVIVIAPTLPRFLAPQRVGEVMRALGPAMGRYLSILAYVVFLSGTLLLASIWGWGYMFRVLTNGGIYGVLLGSGIVAFLAGLAIAETIIMPTGKKLVTLPPETDPALLQRLARKQGIALVVVSVLDFVALAMMALAVNART